MSEEGGWKGEIFLTLYLFSCMVLMLNFLIALLSVVYSNLADQSKALYLSKIIEVQPRWVFHSKFNLFSLRVPPLNLITLFALPCFKNCSIKSRELIEKVQYLPVYFITLAVVRQALPLSVIVKEVRDELPFTCPQTDQARDYRASSRELPSNQRFLSKITTQKFERVSVSGSKEISRDKQLHR